jgi:hydrogenase maturation protease
MARVLVIGVGNPLRGDDGLGGEVIQRLAPTLPGEAVQWVACHQLAPELAEAVSQAERVAFIDVRRGSPPGELACQPLEPRSGPLAAFSHHLDPPALLAWARALFGTCPPAVLFSVVGDSFGYGEGLSAPVRNTLPELLQRVREWVVQQTRRNELGRE